MALMKYLVKDLVIDNQTNEVSNSGTQILAKRKWLTRDVRNNLMDQFGFSTEELPDNYFITVVDKMGSFLVGNPEDADYIRAGDLGGAYKFSDANKIIADIRTQIKSHKTYDFAKVPGSKQISLFDHINKVNGCIKTIQNFNPKADSMATETHRNITSELQGEYNSIFELFNSINTAKIATGNNDLDKVIEQFEDKSQTQFLKLEAAVNQAQQDANQVEQLAKAASDVGAKTGISVEARHFHEEYERHVSASKIWLRVAGVFGTVLLVTPLYFYCTGLVPEAEGFAWNYFVPRFSILGILIFLEIILIGIYRAERHNAIVNKHRANALNTFETMTAATLSQDVKDAVTLTAARAIYAPQETGFSKRGANASSTHAADILASLATERS